MINGRKSITFFWLCLLNQTLGSYRIIFSLYGFFNMSQVLETQAGIIVKEYLKMCSNNENEAKINHPI